MEENNSNTSLQKTLYGSDSNNSEEKLSIVKEPFLRDKLDSIDIFIRKPLFEKESKSVVNPSILTEIFNIKDKFIKI